MKNSIHLLLIFFVFASCHQKSTPTSSLDIEGTWKMISAETLENDSLKLKDVSNTTFIKIINKSHFSFFNQHKTESEKFYSGAGTYHLKGNKYTETLEFTSVKEIRNHQFTFQLEIIGDTLIQSGIEKVEAAGINRAIVEKYIKLN
jgi:hypothetical protein